MFKLIRYVSRLLGPPRPYALVIYKPDRMGDFVLALGTIRTLLARYGNESVLLVLSPHGAAMARRYLPEVEILCLPTGCEIRRVRQVLAMFREMAALGRLEARLMVSLKHHKREVDFLYERIISAKERVSLTGPLSVERLSSMAYATEEYPSARKADGTRCLELMAHARVLERILEEEPDDMAVMPALAAPEGSGTVVSPFGTSRMRDLRPDQVAAVLPPKAGRVSLLGLPDHEIRLTRFAEDLSRLEVTDVGVKICHSVDAYLNAIEQSAFVVSTETATAHLAMAYGKKGACLLGGGHFGIFAPWGTGPFRWIYQPMDCFNCNWVCRYPSVRCLEELPPVPAKD